MFSRLVIVASALGLVAGQEMTSVGGDILMRTTRQVGYSPFPPSPASPVRLQDSFCRVEEKKKVRDFKPGRSLVTHEHYSDRNHPASGPCWHPLRPPGEYQRPPVHHRQHATGQCRYVDRDVGDAGVDG